MDIKRYRIVAVGSNSPEVLSKISESLSKHNYEMETISSLRLGHSIVVVSIIQAVDDKKVIKQRLKNFKKKYDMKLIVDECIDGSFKFVKSDAFLRIRGSHEAGIKAYVISDLINAGLDIHGMESNNYDEGEKFLMNIKGQAIQGIESLSFCADKLNKQGIETTLANNWQLLV